MNKTRAFLGRYINFQAAIWGAVVMACIVFGVNYFKTWNLPGSLTASLKQGTYTFLFGGIIMRICEYFATAYRNRALSLVLCVLIPSCIAITLTFTLHSMKGTPRPVASTIPTAMLIVPVTAVWGYRKRKEGWQDEGMTDDGMAG